MKQSATEACEVFWVKHLSHFGQLGGTGHHWHPPQTGIDPPGSNYTPQWPIELATNMARGQPLTLSSWSSSLVSQKEWYRQCTYISGDFYGQGKKRRILRNALICAICHYYAYSFTGRGAQEAYFQGKLYGEAGHYYHRYPATVFFHISPTEEEEDALVLLIEIIMRPVGEFMGHPVIIRSLKPTSNLLSPRSWWWWGRGWYWQCRW